MGTVNDVLSIARKEIGVKEEPPNSNRVKYNKWYYGIDLAGSQYPWCMVFVQWVYKNADVDLPIKTASCGAMMAAAMKSRCFVKSNFMPGDIPIYNFHGKNIQTDHCGIIESVEDDVVHSIEGNTSQDEKGSQSNGGMVCRKVRKKSLIIGAVRPKFEKEDDILDINKLTDDQIIQLASRIQSVLGKTPVSKTLKYEFDSAKKFGITDGTNPNAFCTRAQAAVMIQRIIKE